MSSRGSLLIIFLTLSLSFFGSAQSQPPRYSPSPWKEKEQAMFEALHGSVSSFDMTRLKELIEKKKYPVNRPLPSGFTPLHAFVWRASISVSSEEDMSSQMAKKVIQYLISKGASLSAKTAPLRKDLQPWGPYWDNRINVETPDSLNALQLAVVCGNTIVVQWMLEFDKNITVRDRYGNSLIHLAAMYYYNGRYDSEYIPKLANLLLLDQNALNDSGQNALLVYVSRNQWINTAKLVISEMLQAGANTEQRDKAGRDIYDYARAFNPWLEKWLPEEKERLRLEEVRRQNASIDFKALFQKQTEENLARYRERQKQSRDDCGDIQLNVNTELRYYHHITSMSGPVHKGAKSSEADEPIVVRISPTRIDIDPISRYYGSFIVCSSGVMTKDGISYHLYTFKTTSSNSTYRGFMYSPSQPQLAYLTTSHNGIILLGTMPFEFGKGQ